MKNKNNKLKCLIVLLVFFLSLFFVKYRDTLAIYRGELTARAYLTVLDPSATIEVTWDLNYGEDNVSTKYLSSMY